MGKQGAPQYGLYDQDYIKGSGGSVGVDVSSGTPKTNITAPAGYTWDPVSHTFVHSPTQQGQAVNDYTNAANPALAGLMSSLGGMFSGGGASGAGSQFGGGSPTSGSGSGSFGNGAGGGYGGSGMTTGSRLPNLTLPDQTAGTNAAFATAKDKVGKTARSGLDSLRGELGASGMLGGGAEGQLVRDVIQSGTGELGQVARDQAMKSADLSADFAKTNYAGGITQRGQDVSAQEAQARLAQEGRLGDQTFGLQNQQLQFQKQQAAANQQMQMMELALSGLKGLGGTGGGLVY